MTDLKSGQSFLFVPGDRPERFAKAAASGADAIIIDLEDAVSPDAKATARAHALNYLNSRPSGHVLLRINDAQSAFFEEDVEASQHPSLAGVVLPKANLESTRALGIKLKCPVWPLIETVEGLSRAAEIASLGNIARLMLGTIDLALEMGLDAAHQGGKAMLDQARFALLMASHRAKIPPPVDGVWPSLEDQDGLITTAVYARAAGMVGMMCIHPRQVEALHRTFAPDAAELEWARALLAASKNERASFRFRGQMIDKPILDRARKTLDREAME